MTEQIVDQQVDLGAPVIGYESAGELLAGEKIPPPPELREDGKWHVQSMIMVVLLALIGVLILLIGAVEKCKKNQVEEPAADEEEHRHNAVPNTTKQGDLTCPCFVGNQRQGGYSSRH